MICIATKRKDLARSLRQELQKAGTEAKVVDLNSKSFLKAFYDPEVSAVVTDDEFPGIPFGATADILNSIGRRVPVIVLQTSEPEAASTTGSGFHQIADQITVMSPDQVDDILSSLKLFGALGKSFSRPHCQAIPYYNAQIPISMMKENGALGILTIDASGFSKIGVEYGPDVYNKIKEVFNGLLFNMWGQEGCFRDSDIICRKSVSSNIYYVFLSRSRGTGSLPLPGALEKAADRLAAVIQNSMWNELFASRDKRKIPECVKELPMIGVGFFGVMNNSCIDAHEILDRGLEACRHVAQAQLRRLKDRQRELMQTLIQSQELLYPEFQAVFHLGGITQAHVRDSKAQSSIAPLNDFLFGFESLIRVDREAVESNVKEHGVLDLDPKFLKPDVLFGMAKVTKVALELDQACLKLAAAHSTELPGTLMVNILPRNLYHIDRLDDAFQGRKNIVFEVSESEAISNFDLMLHSRELLEKNSMGIAADDFGKGYASLERIIKIRPNIIKFDRSVIQDIHEDPIKQAYVKGLVEAGKFLKTLTLAEGVEKWEEAVVLQAMGIDLIQGFLLHRPQKARVIMDQIGVTALVGAA